MHLLSGYNKPIKALAISPDGTRLFTVAQGQKMVWEWDLAARQVKQKLGGHRNHVDALATSPDGKWLVAAESWLPGVLAYPLDGGEPVRFEESDGDRTASDPNLSIHPDGNLVAAPWHNYRERACGFQLWDLATGKKVKAVKGHLEYVNAVAFCPVGTVLAAADRHVRLWDYETAQPGHHLPHPAIPRALAFRADGKVLVTGAGRSLLVWEVQSGQLMRTLAEQGGQVTGLAYSPDGKYLAAIGHDGFVLLRDARTHEVVGRRHLDLGKLHSLAWRPDSQGLIVGGSKPIVLCELGELLVKQTGKPKPRGEPLSLAGHKTKVLGLSYSPDGRTLASWDRYGQRQLWDLSGGAGGAKAIGFVKAMSGHYSRGPVSWSPDGERLALEDAFHACLCRVRTNEVIREFGRRGGMIHYLAFTSSGNVFLVRSSDGGSSLRPLSLSLRDAASDEVLFEAEVADSRNCASVRVQTFGEGDERIYVVLDRQSVTRWTPATGEIASVVRQTAQIQHLTVSTDERLMATSGGNSALVWTLPEGKKKVEMKHPLACSGVEFLPGGRLLTSCNDGIVRVWDLSSGTELHAFDLGMGRVYSLAVSTDHMTFAVGVHKGDRIVLMDVPE